MIRAKRAPGRDAGMWRAIRNLRRDAGTRRADKTPGRGGKVLTGLLSLLLSALLLPCLTGGAGAMAEEAGGVEAPAVITATATGEAAELTDSCTFHLCSTARKYTAMTDGKYTSYWESKKIRHPWIALSCETPIHGLYLCFRQMPESFEIQTQDGMTPGEDGKIPWRTVAQGDTRFQHTWYPLEGYLTLRIYTTQDQATKLGMNELFVFGEGEAPAWVQRWQETETKADILFIVAHPDDELLFMGGAIPTYDVAMGKQVVVAYLTWSNTTRRSELLNGLWAMGVRNYPVLGGFSDRYSSKVKDAYDKLGKKKVLAWVTEVFRRYQPEAVVTHDLNGEYGHGQHKMMADACVQAYTLAADATQYPESAAAWGTWQVKKLYLHLYGEEAEQTRFDWKVPLEVFGGKSSWDLACEAYQLHVTQENAEIKIHGKWHVLSMEETGTLFSCTAFGLYATQVGPDETHTDFLEHIPAT